MRVCVAGIHHETNSFSPVATTAAHFRVDRSEAIAQRYSKSRTTVGGLLRTARARNIECVPLMFAEARPSGPLPASLYRSLRNEILDLIAKQGPWDAVLLALHGAAVADGTPDADGDLIATVRDVVGPGVPIGVALDMHANVSSKMVDNSTITTAYQTNPHIDAFERAALLFDLVADTVRRDVTPVQKLIQIPVALNILDQNTSTEPMRPILAAAAAAERQETVLACNVLEGFPYADVAEMGMAVITVAETVDEATEVADNIARVALVATAKSYATAMDVDEALRHANASNGMTLLLDVGDNIGGGSPGDSTIVLAAALRLGVTGFVQSLFDPNAVRRCVEAGSERRVRLEVGAKTDDRHGEPVAVDAIVEHLGDGHYEDPTPGHGGWTVFDMGRCAVLRLDNDNRLLLHCIRVSNTSLSQFSSVGIDPAACNILLAKGVNAPRAAFDSLATQSILLDTDGATAANLKRLKYQEIRRPIHPFDPVPSTT